MKRFSFRIPASTSNLGSGFDALSLALNRYLNVSMEESSDFSIEARGVTADLIPTDAQNLILRVANSVAGQRAWKLPAFRLIINNEIPLARGLGSSAAAIVAGITCYELLTRDRLSDDEIFAKKSLEQINAERPLADVFFDLDESTVRNEARPSLQKNAEWLKRWASTRITVEGHCDERGSGEYNLALGDRRANAVKAYLVSLGIGGDRIAVVTKGKEQPFCRENGESCWQQNRRGHFMVTAK